LFYLTSSIAGLAAGWGGTRFGSGTVAAAANFMTGEFDLFIGAEHSFFEGKI
jgi:hypothetical protein